MCCVLIVLLVQLAGFEAVPSEAKRPPIVLVSLDTLRADRLGQRLARQRPIHLIKGDGDEAELHGKVRQRIPALVPKILSRPGATAPEPRKIADTKLTAAPTLLAIATHNTSCKGVIGQKDGPRQAEPEVGVAVGRHEPEAEAAPRGPG